MSTSAAFGKLMREMVESMDFDPELIELVNQAQAALAEQLGESPEAWRGAVEAIGVLGATIGAWQETPESGGWYAIVFCTMFPSLPGAQAYLATVGT